MDDIPAIDFSADIKKKRQMQRIKSILLPVAGIVVAVALVICVILLSNNKKTIDVANYQVEGIVLDIQTSGNNAILLMQTKTVYLSPGGRPDQGSTFSYSDPSLVTNGRNVLVFDRGGTGYRVERNKKTYYYGDAPGIIVAATAGRKNVIAFSVDSEKDSFAQSSVFVRRSKKDNAERIYKSENEYCIALAVSDDDKYVCAALLGIENAEYTLRFVTVNLKTDEATEIGKLKGCVLVSLDYTSDDRLCVMTDEGIYYELDGKLDDDCKIEKTDLILSKVNLSGMSALVTAANSNKYEPQVSLRDKNGHSTGTFRLMNEIDDIYCSNSYCAVTCNDSAFIYSSDGTLVSRVKAAENCKLIAVSDIRAYILLADGVFIVPVKSDDVVKIGGYQEAETTTPPVEETTESAVSNEATLTDATLSDATATDSDIIPEEAGTDEIDVGED